MKKAILFVRIHWVKMIVAVLLLAVIIASAIFLKYCIESFGQLENFQRRSIAGQMALLLPMFALVQLVALPIMLGMQYYFMQGGFAKMGQSKISMAKVNVKWDEVIGMEGAKQEAWELVKLLKDRGMVKAIGGKIIKGTMMFGPPGCGKTYLAKAIATECGLPFLPSVGSEFVGMFIGVGTARMKSLFKQARVLAEMHGGCIIFIDEIDSFARHRQADRGFGGVMDHNATINQFLTELDGLRKGENNVVVIGATNVSEYELDSAIMRAGRFDRKIHITRPNLKEREQLFAFYLKRIKADADVDSKLLARKALWFSPSDIEGMIREASLIAIREQRDTIKWKDLSEAYDRVLYGLKSNISLSEDEKIWTAYHEAGHAVIAYIEHPTNDVIKATIVPHKGALGFVSHRPAEEQHCVNKEHLLANIKVSVASYVAEQLKFGTTSTGTGGGVGSDFSSAINTARRMVWQYGMGKSGLVGDFSTQAPWEVASWNSGSTLSDKTRETLDADVQTILQTCIKEVHEILSQRMDLLEFFAQELLQKGELEYDEIRTIFTKFNVEPRSQRNKL